MKTPPKKQVDTMPADKYFAYAAELLKCILRISPISPSSLRLKRIGFEVGKSFDLDKARSGRSEGARERARRTRRS